MKRVFSLMLVVCCPIIWFGCGSDDDEAPKVEPTNLSLQADVSDDGSGLVTFTAAGDNVVKYLFTFGEEESETPVLSESGVIEHTYALTGTYTARVVAYSSDNLTASKTRNFTVTNTLEVVWSDEFDGETLSGDYWTHEIGNNNGWGNNELEYYQSPNSTVADGFLTITAKQESVGGKSYTSSRIISKGKKEFKYGRVDIRAKLPKGQGIWPALWMLGANISTVGWPACGEIDIMELVGGDASGRDNTTHGTIHYSNASNNWTYVGGSKTLSSGIFADDFHVFSIIWTNKSIVWKLDDAQFYSNDISSAEKSEFRSNFFLIMNVAVGGNWPGAPDETTVFPQQMIIDYVRLSQ